MDAADVDAAERDHAAFCDAPVEGTVLPCTLPRKTAQYWIEVRVVTRLGEWPLRGVAVWVAGEHWAPTEADGGFTHGAQRRRKPHGSSSVSLVARYVNAGEKLKAEDYEAQLVDVDPAAGSVSGRITQSILKVEDLGGTQRDVDFRSEYAVADHPEEFCWRPGDDSTNGEPILSATVRLATFSLSVPYLNQNIGPDSVTTQPGDGRDPEGTSHRVACDAASNGPWPGNILCSPTSTTMLANYWRRIAGSDPLSRSAVMQRYYDRWAEQKFKYRFDKTQWVPSQAVAAGAPTVFDESARKPLPPPALCYPAAGKMVMQATPPPAPALDSFWLSTAQEPYCLWQCEAVYEWLPNTGVAVNLPASAKPPAQPHPGDQWWPAPTEPATTLASMPPVLVWTARQFRWKRLDEGWWRVQVRVPGASPSAVWKFHDRNAEVAASFAPQGARAQCGLNAKIDGRAPLSRCLPWDKETLDKNRQVPLDPAPLAEYKAWLSQGWPFVVGTNATAGGHVILIRGAVVDQAQEIHWLIANDPYGNLASPGSVCMNFDLSASVGRDLDNLPADVEAVQKALQSAGGWDGDADGCCTGEADDPLVEAIEAYQRDVMKIKKPASTLSPGSAVARKLNLKLGSSVGLSAPARKAANHADDVRNVQIALDALGYFNAGHANGECDDELIEAIVAFQRQAMHMKAPDGFVGDKSPTEKQLAACVGSDSYSNNEKEINAERTNSGDGERGRHVYYRNATAGSKRELRISAGSCARVEYELTPDVLTSQLTSGA